MHSGSQLTDDRLAAWVGLFEQGFGYRGSARQVGVGLESARSLYRRWRIRGSFCMIFCFYISLFPSCLFPIFVPSESNR